MNGIIKRPRGVWLWFIAALFVLAVARSVAAIGAESGSTSDLDAAKQARLAVDSPSMDPSDYASAKASYIESHPSLAESSFSPGPGDEFTETGIVDTGQGPFSPDDFNMQNEWQDVSNGKLTQVWAGAYSQDSDQGVVLVRQLDNWPNPSADDETRKTYDAPGGAGSLQILSVDGVIMTMQAASGDEYSFDRLQGTFELIPSGSSTPAGSDSSSTAG
jgi:hypothetical protein